MSKSVVIASGYVDAAINAQLSISHIMTHLEGLFISDDEACLMQKGDHQEIWLVYDDSRPSELIYKLPKGYV